VINSPRPVARSEPMSAKIRPSGLKIGLALIFGMLTFGLLAPAVGFLVSDHRAPLRLENAERIAHSGGLGASGITGAVKLEFKIDSVGNVVDAHVVNDPVDARAKAAALDAIERLKFRPTADEPTSAKAEIGRGTGATTQTH
jgi:TonB family protein